MTPAEALQAIKGRVEALAAKHAEAVRTLEAHRHLLKASEADVEDRRRYAEQLRAEHAAAAAKRDAAKAALARTSEVRDTANRAAAEAYARMQVESRILDATRHDAERADTYLSNAVASLVDREMSVRTLMSMLEKYKTEVSESYARAERERDIARAIEAALTETP